MLKVFSTGLPLFLLYQGNPGLVAASYLGVILEDKILSKDYSYNKNKPFIFALAPYILEVFQHYYLCCQYHH